ncbi:MAG: hypothetical protein M3510_05625 [Actinomycetota bacterium]|nr:hypothetical protein [Actinomycetota bacterium]
MGSRADPPTIAIARRFAGPADSGNGGYTAGMLAGHLLGPNASGAGARIRLRQPPPLDVAMLVERATDDVGIRVLLGGAVIADAAPAVLEREPVESVTVADACEAETAYAGLTSHPFPACFSCGPQRSPGDGLRLRPGRVGGGRTACTWTPDGSLAGENATKVRDEFVWAALDCPGGWTADLEGRPMVLGTMSAAIDAHAEVGERHIIMGLLLGHEGRKTFTASTLHDSDGRVVARAEHTWIAVDPHAFQ